MSGSVSAQCAPAPPYTLAWFAQYPRLAMRHERRDDAHLAFPQLASALVRLKYLPPDAGF